MTPRSHTPRLALQRLTLLACVGLGWSASSHAQSPTPERVTPTTEVETVVYGEAEEEGIIQKPFPKAVEGTKIFAGKRATVIDLDALPKVQANNYRQALSQTPGILFSEETTPLVSIGYRGIGEPHRFQFMQVLKDGIPIHADPFGYPEAYYTPPLDVVDRIDFVRGGGALMYGPQPGGAFNYVTYMPSRESPFNFRTQNIVGTDNLFSNYTAIDGTSGNWGYYGYFNHRQSDGFRTANSDYELTGGNLKLVYSPSDDTRLIINLDGYEEEHGEPGGLSADVFAFAPETATRLHDRFRLKRYIASAELQHKFNDRTELNVKAWGGYYQRWSKRQNGGSFGALPTGDEANTNKIENQQFYSFGFEPRLRHDWDSGGDTHTLSAGIHFYTARSPRDEMKGLAPDAESGATTLDADRETLYGSLFLENKFTFGKWSITPGARLEMLNQQVVSRKFDASTRALLESASKDKTDIQPLFGLGIAYEASDDIHFYGNVSQSYRNTIFTESIIAQPGVTAVDADPALTWSYELGVRGNATPWITFDSSVFLIDMDNRFGISDGVLRSVGRSVNYGWDAAVEADLVEALTGREQDSKLNLYANVSLLQAELKGGPNDGGRPQYAPDHMVRTGLIYKHKDKLKIGLLGTVVADHKARDDNDPNFAIPSYMTWDLTAEYAITKHFTLMAGLNNLFDEQYYARIRADGIDPAYGRNFYVGGMVKF